MSSGEIAEEEIVDPRCGAALNERYRIVKRIGVGGMGVVYEGLHQVIQRRVAIKMLHPEFTRDREILARFRREAIAATTIRHPHVVEVLDMGQTDDGAAFMVLEFLEGRDWSDDIEKGGMQSLGSVARVLRQVCDGLQAAHDKNIVHRDLKPENVYLARHGSNADFVKIVDFGISKMRDDPDPNAPGPQNLTKTGAAMGTPYAMAPEQMMGQKDVDHRADLWAIGVMLHRALTASYPFDGDTFPLLAVSVLTGDPQPLAKFRSDLPPGVQTIVTRLLEKDRTQRFQSAREIREALAPFESYDAAPVAPRTSFVMAATITPAHPSAQSADAAVKKAIAEAKAAPKATAVGHRVTPPETPSMPPPAPEPEAPAEAKAEPKATKDVTKIAPAPVDRTGPVPALTPPERAGTPLWTGALLAVVLLALGIGGTLATTHYLAPGQAPPTSIAIEALPPSSIAPPPSTSAGPTVRLQITTVPASAELLYDGEPIPNPFDGDVPASSEHHHIVARADGYEEQTRETPMEFPMRVSIELVRAGETPRPHVGHTTSHPPPPSTTTVQVETPVVHVEVPPPPPPPTSEAPPPSTSTTRHGLTSPFSH